MGLADTNRALKKEADSLLYQYGLHEIVGEYGEVTISGSYALDLMVWRDLDLYVDMAGVSMDSIYHLVGRICPIFKPVWAEFKDSREETTGCPQGFFLGFETRVIDSRVWNADIWFADAEYIADRRRYIARIKASLDDERRETILRLKTDLVRDPGYGNGFYSIQVYEAVLQDGVANEEDFWRWLRETGN